MNQTQTNQNKKNRFIPFIWFFGLGLLGGIIFLGSQLGKKNKQLSTLEKQLSETTSTLTDEKSSLQKELQTLNTNYTDLESKNANLLSDLQNQKAKTNYLARQNKDLSNKELDCTSKYSALLGSLDQLKNENALLKNNLAAKETEADGMRKQLANSEALISSKNDVITSQSTKMKSDSAYNVSVLDSIRTEYKTSFVNITELNGAYGLYMRDVAHSNYLYGITNVSGLLVNRHFISGLGIGLYQFDGGTALPLYLDFRYQFNKRKFTPYFYADGGMSLIFKNIGEPMLFINPGFGFYKDISNHFALTFGAGYYVHRDQMYKSSFINFKLGLMYLKSKRNVKLIR